MPPLLPLQIGDFEGYKESSLNEGGLVGVFGVEHDNLFLAVPIFFKDLLLDSEIVLIEGLRRVKIALGVEPDGPDVLLIDGFNLFLLDSFTGFSDDWFDPDHFLQ